MVSYTYRCSLCGKFDRHAPMGAGGPSAPCPTCDTDARRVFAAPRLGVARSDARLKLIESTQRSAFEPPVVDSLPAAGKRARQPVTRDPRHTKLPRP